MADKILLLKRSCAEKLLGSLLKRSRETLAAVAFHTAFCFSPVAAYVMQLPPSTPNDSPMAIAS